MHAHTDQSLDPVLVSLLKGGTVDLSQLGGVEADELWLDLLQQSFNLPLLPLLCTAVWICIQTVKVGLTCTCSCKSKKMVVKTQIKQFSDGGPLNPLKLSSDFVPYLTCPYLVEPWSVIL